MLGRENEARTVWGHGAWGARHVGAEECVREHCSTCDRKVNLLELCKRVCKNLIQKYSFCFSLGLRSGFSRPRGASALRWRRDARRESRVWRQCGYCGLWSMQYAQCRYAVSGVFWGLSVCRLRLRPVLRREHEIDLTG